MEINYVEDKLLGTGSSGVVTWAYDADNNLRLAVKKIYIGNSNLTEINRLKKEVEILQHLYH